MTDYERGVNQASAIYQEAIKDYVAENEKLRDELRKMDQWHSAELTAALDENAKLRDIAHKTWRLLLATGNDDLVLSIEANGEVKELIDADELAKAMRELGIEVD